MKRTAAREIAVRLCFAMSENPVDAKELIESTFRKAYYSTLKDEDELYEEPPDEKQLDYITRLVTGVQEHAAELDGYIEKYSVGWKFSRISRTATAIMRIAMFEVLYMPEVPESAAINEAIELAKTYETDETRSFINGILGSFSRTERGWETAQSQGIADQTRNDEAEKSPLT